MRPCLGGPGIIHVQDTGASGRELQRAAALRGAGRGLTLVHLSAQLEPCLTTKNALHTRTPPNTPSTRATQPQRAPPIPNKPLTLSQKVDECKPLAPGRDETGGEQVNLLPRDRPGDVYTGIANLLRKVAETDAANDMEPDKQRYARVLLPFIDRKLAGAYTRSLLS